jgi:hypothetical protein
MSKLKKSKGLKVSRRFGGYNKGTGVRSGERFALMPKLLHSREERCAVNSQPRGSALRWSSKSYMSKFI